MSASRGRSRAPGGGKAGVGPAFIVATLVHLLTVACVGFGAYLTVATWFAPVTLLGPVLIAIGIFVRPRLPRAGAVVAAVDVPALAAYVAEVAARVGCAAPDAFTADNRFNASVSRVLGPRLRRTTVLSLGRLLWAPLCDEERTALLAHELGHTSAGDPTRSWYVRSAERTLREWQRLLAPTRTPMRGRVRRGAVEVAVAEMLAPLILAPLSASVGLLAVAHARTVNRRARRTEMLADRTAVRVAGAAATRRLLSTLVLEDVVRIAISSARARGETDLPSVIASRAVARVPDSERERKLRRERLLGDTGDRTHPPTFRRVALVDALRPAAVAPIAVDMAAVDRDVARL